jgi:hypothetical protein
VIASLTHPAPGVTVALPKARRRKEGPVTSDGMSLLRERVAAADVIVSGTVVGTEAVDPPPGTPISHHEPLRVAVKIRIDSVLKGDLAGDTVVAEIARSPDPRIDSGVRPEVGQQGVWVLHRTPDDRLTMEQAVDYQPLEAAHRIAGLVSE